MKTKVKDLIKTLQPFKEAFQKNPSKFYTMCSKHHNMNKIMDRIKEFEAKDFEGMDEAKNCAKKFNGKFGIESISYYDLYGDEFQNIIVFVIPKGLSLPAHDHPGMIVFGKVLFGEIAYNSWDVNDLKVQSQNSLKYYAQPNNIDKLPDLNVSNETSLTMKENDLFNLNPINGNIHSLEALENSAFIDILFPDYDFSERFCNYYTRKDEKTMRLIHTPIISMKEYQEN